MTADLCLPLLQYVAGSRWVPLVLRRKDVQNEKSSKILFNVAEHFIQNNYTSHDHLYVLGGSAGGLLMNALNLATEEIQRTRPVMFICCLTFPSDNVTEQEYPHMLPTTD